MSPDPVTTHNEYTRLLQAYLEAKRTYQVDDSKANWDRLQQATIRLKRHCDLTEQAKDCDIERMNTRYRGHRKERLQGNCGGFLPAGGVLVGDTKLGIGGNGSNPVCFGRGCSSVLVTTVPAPLIFRHILEQVSRTLTPGIVQPVASRSLPCGSGYGRQWSCG